MVRPNKQYFELLRASKAKLQSPRKLFFYPFLIGAALIFFLSSTVHLNVNNRLGHSVDPLEMEIAQPPKEGEHDDSTTNPNMWIGLHLEEGKVIASTKDRATFKWDSHLTSTENAEFSEFKKYLAEYTENNIATSVMAGKISNNSAHIVFSVDQTMTYMHFKPILKALAAARITNYSFEVKIKFAQNAQHHEGDTHHE